MAGVTLAQAESHLSDWLSADSAVSNNQSYSIAGRTLTRADAETIRQNIEYWDRKVKELSRKGIRVRGITPG